MSASNGPVMSRDTYRLTNASSHSIPEVRRTLQIVDLAKKVPVDQDPDPSLA
jgi:hypothetical protein